MLSGQLDVADAYAVFGTAFLRQTQPLRRLLDPSSARNDEYAPDSTRRRLHKDLQAEVQGWLMYHEGVRRRCLILIDLLWAEAARLEDLPPSDVRRAAEAKRSTGGMNRRRLVHECLRLRGLSGARRAHALARFLKHAEFRRWYGFAGLRARRLDSLEESWLGRVLAADDADDSPNEV